MDGTSKQSVIVTQLRDEIDHSEVEVVPVELPVAVQYNGISQAVMLTTPSDLIDFAYGFSYTENIIDESSNIYDVQIVPSTQAIVLEITIAERFFSRLRERRRSLAGRSSCGLCGVESLELFQFNLEQVPNKRRFDLRTILNGVCAINQFQPLQSATGSCHAAGWLVESGSLSVVREDIGRHNAVDKVIGSLLRSSVDVSKGVLVVTSRISYEIVSKAASAGIGFVVGISGATNLAISIADHCGITLLGFVRGSRCVIYTHDSDLVRTEV